jgi:AcrR family transcriptional regulator
MAGTRSPHRRTDDRRRAQLVSAARTVIARDGVAAATTRRITQEAGLPHGTFHYWFSGKEELFEELIAEMLAGLRDSVPDASPDAVPSLLGLFLAAFDVVRRDEQTRPGYQLACYELTALALRTPALRDLARRQYQAYRDTAAAATGPWMATRHVDLPGGADALNRLIAVLFDGISLAWLADPEGTNPDELFTLIADLIEARVSRAPSPGRE